jgi:hypothetical protein
MVYFYHHKLGKSYDGFVATKQFSEISPGQRRTIERRFTVDEEADEFLRGNCYGDGPDVLFDQLLDVWITRQMGNNDWLPEDHRFTKRELEGLHQVGNI